MKLIRLKEIGSTNEYAKELIKKDIIIDDTAIVAEVQSEGRGRYDRQWSSPKGGLWLTIIKKAEISQKYPFVCALAVIETIKNYTEPKIKWPNDILINGKKVCGILVESVKGSIIISGIGLNVNNTVFPRGLRQVPTSLKLETKKKFDLDKLMYRIIENFNVLKEMDIVELVNENLYKIGGECTIKADKEYMGEIVGIDEEFYLEIRTNSGIKKFVDGEIHFTL